MSYVKEALDKIKNCQVCWGKGYTGSATYDGYEYEYCDCNPNCLDPEDM